MEETLPAWAHAELSVSAMAMQEERLAEHREVPVQAKEDSDGHDVSEGLRGFDVREPEGSE
jgi:hypothetical protein